MESLFKLQKDTQNIIEKGHINFKKSPKERITRGYVETRLENLEELWRNFNDVHRKIIERATAEETKGSYFKLEVYDKVEDNYIEYKSELKDRVLHFEDSRAKESCEQASANVKPINVNLPKISIPTFYGKYSEWTSFRDLFTSLVHNNKSIDNVQKLHYLKGSLAGEAEQLLRQIPITASNYDVCWSQLEHRYNNKRHLANNILQRLFNQKRVVVESAVTLKHLLDTTTDCMSALNNLGVNVTTWDIIVIHIVSSKLDQETRKQWELKVASDSPTELPSLDQFKSFIESRFRALEFIEPQRAVGNSHGNNSHNHKVMLATHKTDFASRLRCEYCSEDHKLCFCKQFLKLDLNERRKFVLNNKICFNCLGGNHMVGQCKKSTVCRVCRKRHHSCLHLDGGPTKDQQDKVGDSSDTRASGGSVPIVSCLSTKVAHPSRVLLATALLKAQTATHNYQIVRALLDQGSQASFVSEATVQFLRLKRSPVKGVISGLGSDKTLVTNSVVTLVIKSLTDSNFMLEVKAYVLKTITSFVPERKLDLIAWPELDHLHLADPQFQQPSKIDVLLGADVYCKVLKDGMKKAPNGAFAAQNTSLGWILSGAPQLKEEFCSTANQIKAMHGLINENDSLKRFWEIEDLPQNSKKILTEEEKRCEELFASTTKRTENGRYVVRLPFKDENPACIGGNSRQIAIRRFKSLEQRFNKDQELKERYTKVIKEYVQLGHMRKIQGNDSKKHEAVYLPHHAVIKEEKATTKVRVVFDASCKNENGVSLNDTLMIGPTLQSDLRHIVLRWRKHRITIVADIVKMYRQVKVAEEDMLYQRIVWRDNIEDEIEDYCLTTVTFGTASAPYLAVKALHQVAVDEAKQFPAASERVPNSFYMDDLMTGCSSVEVGKKLCTEMKELLGKAGFELQKWYSNNKEILREIEYDEEGRKYIEDKESGSKKDGIEIYESTKILGLTWYRSSDEFKYTVQLPSKSEKVTKRNIIADIARLFDPLGWLAPSIILGKIIIQKLWLAGIGWDDVVPNNLRLEWETYRTDLLQLSKVRVPRWVGTTEDSSIVELQGFSDASKSAYAAVVYIRTIDSAGNVTVALLTAKTKVAPIKQLSVPRLELCGAVLLARLLADVAEAMNIPKSEVHAWTDSTVVLAWLNSHPSRWKTFVGNRVSEILSTLDSDQWAHVSSKENPADCASRGVQPALLSENELWFGGPEFLYKPDIVYSRPTSQDVGLEECIKSHVALTEDETPWSNFSSLWRMLRVIAFCRRLRNFKDRKNRPNYVQKTELDEVLNCCIRYSQKREFHEEYIQIKNKTYITAKNSKIKSLTPFIDQDKIMRVGGRLHKSPLSDQSKHPIILPHQAHLTKLLVADAHERTMHGGVQLMINYLRSAYWIVGVKSLMK